MFESPFGNPGGDFFFYRYKLKNVLQIHNFMYICEIKQNFMSLLTYKQIKMANELIADGYELQPNENNRNTLVLKKENSTIKLLPSLKTKNKWQNKN